MTYSGAIVAAAGLIAGALVLTGTGQSQPQPVIGRYALVADAGSKWVWRLDTSTGALQLCRDAQNNDVECSNPAKLP